MLTLVVTVLATAYFVAPELLSRFILGFFLVRKTMNAPKSEEIVRGACWALIPLWIAWSTRNTFGVVMPANALENLQTTFSGLYSDKYFIDHTQEFYKSVATTIKVNRCLLVREYLIVMTVSVVLGVVARYFGRVRRLFKWNLLCLKLLHGIVLPRISEWHVSLSPMLLPKRNRYSIEIDVMTKSGILYRGAIHEKHIGQDGTLQTLVLSAPDRYLHTDFVRDRTAYENLGEKTGREKPLGSDYWRKIKGDLFLIVGNDVASVNVRYVAKTMTSLDPRESAELMGLLREVNTLLKQKLSGKG